MSVEPGFIDKMVGKFEEWLPMNYREKAPKIPMKAGEQLDDLVRMKSGRNRSIAVPESGLCDELRSDHD
jgi:hypothetical protein